MSRASLTVVEGRAYPFGLANIDTDAIKNGLLAAVLPSDAVTQLLVAARLVPLRVDVKRQRITTSLQHCFIFRIDAWRIPCLLEGTDEIGLTRARGDGIGAFERRCSDHAVLAAG